MAKGQMMKFFRRLRLWMQRRDLDRDFDEEVRQHLELKIQENIARGMTPGEALRAARVEFGNAALVKEQSRASWGFPLLESFWQDIRYGVRQLRKSPGFTGVAVMTLALGIGANVAIFSAVYAAILQPLPFKDPGRLVSMWKENPQRGWTNNPISPAEFLAWRAQTHAFEDMAAYRDFSCVLNTAGHAEEDPCQYVTSNLFAVVGVAPLRGRAFSPEQDKDTTAQVAILSYGLWQRLFARNESMIGRAIQINGTSVIVVGVMPPSFSPQYASPYEDIPQLWLSGIGLSPSQTSNDYAGVGRLRRGANLAQAQAEMNAVSQRLEQLYSEIKGWRAALMTLQDKNSGDARPALMVLMGAVTFVLLIACANVANLLLSRSMGRAGEFAVRRALGASQTRLVRQLLTESLMVSLSGGALGILLASWGAKGLAALAPGSLVNSAPRLSGAVADWRVLVFAVGMAVATTFLFGLAPALQSARPGVAQTMKETGRASLETRRSRRFRGGLVITEVALAMVLLVAAGLMIRTLAQLIRVPLGFNGANVLTLSVPLSGEHYKKPEAIAEFWRQVTARVKALPGVESASMSRGMPINSWAGQFFFTAEQPDPPAGQIPDANYILIGPDYFRTLQIPILSGRHFSEHDNQSAEQVVIINEELARKYWPSQNPLGKKVRIASSDGPWRSIVGVAGNVLSQGVDAGVYPELYVPYEQFPWTMGLSRLQLLARTSSGISPESIAQSAVRAIHGVDKDQPVVDIQTLEELTTGTRAQPRMLLALLGGFAGLALVLSAMGIYSVLSYSVAQRTREIGVRVALGAQRADILQLIIGGGARLALFGIGTGVAVAMISTRLMTDLLYGVHATDPATFCVVVSVLGVAAFVACYVPARRAARVDPLEALRTQ